MKKIKKSQQITSKYFNFLGKMQKKQTKNTDFAH